jgi:hypothetical protein
VVGSGCMQLSRLFRETSRSQLNLGTLDGYGPGCCRYRRAFDRHWAPPDFRQGLMLCALDHTMPSQALARQSP